MKLPDNQRASIAVTRFRTIIFTSLLLFSTAFAQTLPEVLTNDGRFTRLVSALESAGLVDRLSETGPFTVFAPTDEAFAALPQSDLDALLADPAALQELLLHHVVADALSADDLTGMDSVTPLAGDPLSVAVGSPDATGALIVGDAEVVDTIQASNGVVHAIDNVLMPAMTAETPATPDEAMTALQELLTGGVDTVATPQVVAAFRNLRLTLEASGDDSLEVVAVALTPVEQSLEADPFAVDTLVSSLQELATSMRVAGDSGSDEGSLMVELASLVDQTAAFIEAEGYTPRMEVGTP